MDSPKCLRVVSGVDPSDSWGRLLAGKLVKPRSASHRWILAFVKISCYSLALHQPFHPPFSIRGRFRRGASILFSIIRPVSCRGNMLGQRLSSQGAAKPRDQIFCLVGRSASLQRTAFRAQWYRSCLLSCCRFIGLTDARDVLGQSYRKTC